MAPYARAERGYLRALPAALARPWLVLGAAFAGALGRTLGGVNVYRGAVEDRGTLGAIKESMFAGPLAVLRG